jgi:hypothetical protein
MSSLAIDSPEQHVLWPGAMLGAIAHAVFVCRHPNLSYEQSWDGDNYNVQDSAGSRGAVAFSQDKCVGAFFYEPSHRNPFRFQTQYDVTRFFSAMPEEFERLAYDEALQYLLQELNGSSVPVITSAFWTDGESRFILAGEPWTDVFDNGALIMRNQLLEPEFGLANWREEFQLTSSEESLVLSLFHRKSANPTQEIQLDVNESRLLESLADSPEGIEACRESLSEIRIIF